MKKAVVLFNLGGPDAPKNVKPFLFKLFNDRAIINLPQPFRFFLAKIISGARNKKAQGIYAQIGGRSPILELTNKQADALQTALGNDNRVFVSMRYWHPMSREVAKKVADYAPDEIILLPLYPQYSTTTSESSINDFKKNYKGSGNIKTIDSFQTQPDFIEAHTDLILPIYEKFPNARVLFSAHGLPEKVIAKGDPYEEHTEQSARAIAKALNLKDWRICYQSKVGPLPWLQPTTESEIRNAARDGVAIILVPISFVSEHSETLVELDIQFKELADDLGVKTYIRIPALGTQPKFIEALKKLVTG